MGATALSEFFCPDCGSSELMRLITFPERKSDTPVKQCRVCGRKITIEEIRGTKSIFDDLKGSNEVTEERYKQLINLYARFFAGEAKHSDDPELQEITTFWNKVYEKTKTNTSFSEAGIKANEAVLSLLMLKDATDVILEDTPDSDSKVTEIEATKLKCDTCNLTISINNLRDQHPYCILKDPNDEEIQYACPVCKKGSMYYLDSSIGDSEVKN